MFLLMPMVATAAHGYEMGSYRTVTSVDTKDGRFGDYMTDLSKVWRKSPDMMTDDKKVKSFRMFANVHARHNEPDLYLLVEWTSAGAALDTPEEYWDANFEKLFGSEQLGEQANIARGELRKLLSESLMREMHFK